MNKKALIVHSGGFDSSLTLALALKEFPSSELLSISFSYNQRHSNEIQQAGKIASYWHVDHYVMDLSALPLGNNALTDQNIAIHAATAKKPATTLVLGRNGLMARLAAIYGCSRGSNIIYMGVMEGELEHAGYRDCSRKYMDLKEQILQLDFEDPNFEIRTPLITLSKFQSLELANSLGVLDFLLTHTITCYQGISEMGCRSCPACLLRNNALKKFHQTYPHIVLPYNV